jgi:hypothetical protein
VSAALAVSVTLPPEQNDVAPAAVIVVTGVSTVTTVGWELIVQLAEYVAVTVYEPAALTVIDWVVSPSDHA